MQEGNNGDCMSLLNESECFEIVKNDLKLKDDNNLILKSYKIVKCSADLLGFMGEYYKLMVDVEQGENSNQTMTLSYFIKSLPLTNRLYRAELERKRVIEKESDIYAKILPNIQRYSTTPLFPESYLTRKDLMVLEDYSGPEKSLKQMQENEVYTNKHHQVFMQHLAKLHAASLAWECKESLNIGQQFDKLLFELELTSSNMWYITGIKSVLYLAQQHPTYQYTEAQDFINQQLYDILYNMEEYTTPSRTQRNVLCHRDSWDRNIFWEYDLVTEEPTACRIVDFQLARYSPPAIDVLYYLCNYIQDGPERHILLKHYHDSLKLELKHLDLPEDLITKEQFDVDCKRALLPVLTNCSICEPLMKLPEGWSQVVRETEPDKYDSYMHCDRTEMFERVSQIDPTYIETIRHPVQEIMEYFGYGGK